MCGLAGIVSANKELVNFPGLKAMSGILAHRGPNGDGHWINDEGSVGFAFRRLSIIDLSEAGSQPMHYLDRYTIVYNGEIYNYLELKEELIRQGYQFKSKTDTEVLLALYDKYKHELLQKLDGMFSFVIYDDVTKELFCARDRFGEKPFFYSYEPGKEFIFGSEMKSIWTTHISKEVDPVMLYNYVANGFVENPFDQKRTFFKGCLRLPQAHYLRFDTKSFTIIAIEKYWDIDPGMQDLDISVEKASCKFNELLYTSVSRRLRSDVSVGNSLSGGLDSSLLVCIINDIRKKQTHAPVGKTFSARFRNYSLDEGYFIGKVMEKIKMVDYHVFPTAEGMVENLDKVMYHQEEPFPTSSVYAQYAVMELAKEQNVSVLIDGQGADEVLAGYPVFYYQFFKELKHKYRHKYKQEFQNYSMIHRDNQINAPIKKDLEYLLRTTLPGTIQPLIQLKNVYRHHVSQVLSSDFYSSMRKHDFRKNFRFNSLNESLHQSTFNSPLHLLLRYVDRNSMAHGREVRLPFLSHELVTFIFSLPPYFKIHDGWTKWIMRETYKNFLPQEICWRKDKIGFDTPEKNWLQSDIVTDRLIAAKKKLVEAGIFSKKTLNQKLSTLKKDSWNDNWIQLTSAYFIKWLLVLTLFSPSMTDIYTPCLIID